MQIHDVIKRAALHIEWHPQNYEFTNNLVPLHRDQIGCALGWIGHFSGQFPHLDRFPHYGVEVDNVAHEYLGLSHFGRGPVVGVVLFYTRMDELCGSADWMQNAKLCALGLRAYARCYHPRVSSEIPMAVRDIFAAPVTAAPL